MGRMKIADRIRIYLAEYKTGMTAMQIGEKHAISREYVLVVLNRSPEYRALRKKVYDRKDHLTEKAVWLVASQGYTTSEVAKRYGMSRERVYFRVRKKAPSSLSGKPIRVTDVDTGEVRIFPSVIKASEELYYGTATIHRKALRDSKLGQIDKEFKIEYMGSTLRPLKDISEEEVEETMARGGNLNR